VLGSSYANPGESLADDTTGTEIDSPLNNTPGYALSGNSADYTIATITGAEYGFTSLYNIYGARRIHGGGLFLLRFDPSTDLLSSVDFSDASIASLYGDRGANQSIAAVYQSDTPEPTTGLYVISALALLGVCRIGRAGRSAPRS
jgi:hypothetical protein